MDREFKINERKYIVFILIAIGIGGGYLLWSDQRWVLDLVLLQFS